MTIQPRAESAALTLDYILGQSYKSLNHNLIPIIATAPREPFENVDFAQVDHYGREIFFALKPELGVPPMRMIVPSLRERQGIDRLLVAFFRDHRLVHFNRAISEICRFYRLRRPQVDWFEYLDWGRTAGRTYENGKIHLVHPENWKKGRKYNSEKQWVNAVYHEMGHYVFWSDAERKADTFANRMERNVSRNGGALAQARVRIGRKAA